MLNIVGAAQQQPSTTAMANSTSTSATPPPTVTIATSPDPARQIVVFNKLPHQMVAFKSWLSRPLGKRHRAAEDDEPLGSASQIVATYPEPESQIVLVPNPEPEGQTLTGTTFPEQRIEAEPGCPIVETYQEPESQIVLAPNPEPPESEGQMTLATDPEQRKVAALLTPLKIPPKKATPKTPKKRMSHAKNPLPVSKRDLDRFHKK